MINSSHVWKRFSKILELYACIGNPERFGNPLLPDRQGVFMLLVVKKEGS